MLSQRSKFLYLWCWNIRIDFLQWILGHLYVVSFAFVIFGEPMVVAVGALATLAQISQESYFLLAAEAARVVGLFRWGLLGYLGYLKVFYFAYDLLCFLLGSKFQRGYLKQTEHMFIFCGFPKNFLHLVHKFSDITLNIILCYIKTWL